MPISGESHNTNTQRSQKKRGERSFIALVTCAYDLSLEDAPACDLDVQKEREREFELFLFSTLNLDVVCDLLDFD